MPLSLGLTRFVAAERASREGGPSVAEASIPPSSGDVDGRVDTPLIDGAEEVAAALLKAPNVEDGFHAFCTSRLFQPKTDVTECTCAKQRMSLLILRAYDYSLIV